MKKQSVLFLFALLNLYIIESKACNNCYDKKRSIKYSLSKSDLIFSGKVIATDHIAIQPSYTSGGTTYYVNQSQYEYKILISNIYKGNLLSDTVTLIFPVRIGDCAYEFQKDKDYIIYAQRIHHVASVKPRGEVRLWVSICPRTKLESEKEIRKLRKLLSAGR